MRRFNIFKYGILGLFVFGPIAGCALPMLPGDDTNNNTLGHDSAIVGQWADSSNSVVYYEFQANGTFIVRSSQSYSWEAGNGQGNYWTIPEAKVPFTYTILSAAKVTFYIPSSGSPLTLFKVP